MNLKSLLHRELCEGTTEQEIASSVGVSLRTITNILRGKTPTVRTIWEKFARYFRMDVDFLRSGDSTYRTSHSAAGRIRNIPLISWQQMGQMANGRGVPTSMHAEAVIEATDVSGNRTFALKLQDDSMEPLFHKGEIIFVNPDVKWNPEDYVVVTRRGESIASTVLRQLRTNGDQRMLHSLNWEYEEIPLAESDLVWGKVVRVRKISKAQGGDMNVVNQPGVPVGGFKTIGQINPTNSLCFKEDRNGLMVALDLLATHTAGAPVVDDRMRYLGFINEFDVMRALDNGKDLSKLQAKDIMRKARLTVTDSTPISQAARLMEEHHVLSLPVEKDGTVLYSVMRHDLLRARIGLGVGMGIDP
jgi:CBS domain-containing protein/transcriptional regulator with XRE-family HTH domain